MKTKTNLYLFLIALISAMGGFLFGYDWVVIGGAKPFMNNTSRLPTAFASRVGYEQCVDRLPHRRVERGQAE